MILISTNLLTRGTLNQLFLSFVMLPEAKVLANVEEKIRIEFSEPWISGFWWDQCGSVDMSLVEISMGRRCVSAGILVWSWAQN